MSTLYGWTGPDNDDRWEAAERADHEAAQAERLAERMEPGVPFRHNGCAACEGVARW